MAGLDGRGRGAAAGLRHVRRVGAGDLVGAAATTKGPVIAGTWESARSGLDAAVWLPDGPKWVRQPSAGTALESTAELLASPHAVTAAGASVVIAGSVLQLETGAVRQLAATWRSDELARGWQRTVLPDAGRRSEAAAASCSQQRCVFAGYVDGALALWSMTEAGADRIADVPEVPADIGTTIPAPVVVDDAILQVASAAAGSVVLVRRDSSWRVHTGPGGTATSAAAAGPWLYVVTRTADGTSGLWRAPITELLRIP